MARFSHIDDNLERYTFNVATESVRRYPTTRIDYNITDKHRYSNAFNYRDFTDFPDTLNNMDPSFPGFPVEAGQKSERYSVSNSLRSTLEHQHGQRSAGRLERRTGHVLRRAEP